MSLAGSSINSPFRVILSTRGPKIAQVWQKSVGVQTHYFKNNRAPLLCYFKLFASFHSRWWVQTGVTIWKRLIWVKIDDFFSRVTVQFDVWPWKTIGHLFHDTSSFVYHFVAIGEFKLALQSGNAQFGSNSTIFRAVCSWHLTYDLENNRAPLICYFKLCASFHSHRWIQTEATVRKHLIWVKFDDF